MTVKPVATTAQFVEALRTAGGSRPYHDWSHRTHVDYTIGNQNGLMTQAQKDHARYAFEAWDDVVAIDLIETASGNDIAFNYDDGPYSFANKTFAGRQMQHVDVLLSSQWDSNQASEFQAGALGKDGLLTFLHEIGHALGLTHPGNYADFEGGNTDYETNAQWAQDTRQYTVMSYFNAGVDGSDTDYYSFTEHEFIRPSTPLLYDIAALQAIHGADLATRAGNTVYGFNSTAGKLVDGTYFDPYDFERSPNSVFCIWDGGGDDTIDASLFVRSQTIRLGAGQFSTVGEELVNNVSIAFGALIENALGGSGDDRIFGNAAANRLNGNAGSDILFGFAGNDDLDGGSDNDTLSGGTGNDTLAGGGGDDTLYGFAEPAVEEFSADDDRLFGGAGNDRLWGGNGNDLLKGGADNDELFGGHGNDQLFGGSGSDTFHGGAGADALNGNGDPLAPGAIFLIAKDVATIADAELDIATYIDSGAAVGVNLLNAAAGAGDARGDTFVSIEVFELTSYADFFVGSNNVSTGDFVRGGFGADRLSGNGGNDRLHGEAGHDRIDGGYGLDTLDGGEGNDVISGGGDADVLLGGDGSDKLNGDAGDDMLSGGERSDQLAGGTGNDTLIGGAGRDRLSGGAGRDTFVFASVTDSYKIASGPLVAVNSVDTITDFTRFEDVIDLSRIDADASTPGDDAFVFGAPEGALVGGDWTGRVWTRATNGVTTVYASTNADAVAELQIDLSGVLNLAAADFVL